MTQCDEETSLLQCGSGYAARFHFAGKSAADLKNFKSSAALMARERAARLALGKPLHQFGYKKTHNKKHGHLNLKMIARRHVSGKALAQHKQPVEGAPEGITRDTETLLDLLGVPPELCEVRSEGTAERLQDLALVVAREGFHDPVVHRQKPKGVDLVVLELCAELDQVMLDQQLLHDGAVESWDRLGVRLQELLLRVRNGDLVQVLGDDDDRENPPVTVGPRTGSGLTPHRAAADGGRRHARQWPRSALVPAGDLAAAALGSHPRLVTCAPLRALHRPHRACPCVSYVVGFVSRSEVGAQLCV